MKRGEATTFATATAVWMVYSLLRGRSQLSFLDPFTLYFIAFLAISIGLASAILGVRGYKVMLYSSAGWVTAIFIEALLSGEPLPLDPVQTYINLLVRDLLTVIPPSSVTLAAALNALLLRTLSRPRRETQKKLSSAPGTPQVVKPGVTASTQPTKAEEPVTYSGSFSGPPAPSGDATDRLLNQLSKGVGTITPKRDYYAFSGVSFDVAKELGLENDAVKESLEKLKRDGLIENGETAFKTLACPYCNSTRLSFDIVCPTCGAVDIERYWLVGCPSCGTFLPSSYYRVEEREGILYLRCPTCGYTFTKKAGEGSIIYKCNKCESPFKSPRFIATCTDCGRTHPEEMLNVMKYHTYRLKKGIEREIKDVVFRGLEAALTGKAGLALKKDLTLHGKGGTHVIDLAVLRENKVLVSIFFGCSVERLPNKAIMDAVIASIDGLELGSVIVISSEPPDPSMKKLAEVSKIKVLQISLKDAKSLEEVILHVVRTVEASAS